MDWTHIRAFLATAEQGSLSAAARSLGLTQPTLSRQVSALEGQLGLLLFERRGKRISLTDAGQTLLVHAREMGSAAEKLALSASGQRSDIAGKIRITAADILSATFLPVVLKEIQARAPLVSVEVVATNDISDLMKREADIAIRHVRPEQPELIGRLVREATAHLYADKALLDRIGRPRTKADLSQIDWVSFGDVSDGIKYMSALGIALTEDQFRTGSDNGLVAWEMAKQGLGVCVMDTEIAKLSPQMEAILPEELEITFPYWLVSHREIHTSPRIRLVYDILAEALVVKGA